MSYSVQRRRLDLKIVDSPSAPPETFHGLLDWQKHYQIIQKLQNRILPKSAENKHISLQTIDVNHLANLHIFPARFRLFSLMPPGR